MEKRKMKLKTEESVKINESNLVFCKPKEKKKERVKSVDLKKMASKLTV
jgi:hypothetical protein